MFGYFIPLLPDDPVHYCFHGTTSSLYCWFHKFSLFLTLFYPKQTIICVFLLPSALLAPLQFSPDVGYPQSILPNHSTIFPSMFCLFLSIQYWCKGKWQIVWWSWWLWRLGDREKNQKALKRLILTVILCDIRVAHVRSMLFACYICHPNLTNWCLFFSTCRAADNQVSRETSTSYCFCFVHLQMNHIVHN